MAGRGARQRAIARKQRDKWKAKRWYTIRAPRHPWEYKAIGETLGEEDGNIMGRVYEMTQQEFDGNFNRMHVKIRFKVSDVVGQDALTDFIGHEFLQDHIRRAIRRHRGKIDDTIDVVTNDGFMVRIKTLIITEKRVQTSQKVAIRNKSRDFIFATAAKSTYANLQRVFLGDELESGIQQAVKPIHPVRTVFVRKSTLLEAGVEADEGPTLDEIVADEERKQAEIDARKAAALSEAEEEEEEGDVEETPSPKATEPKKDASKKAESVKEVKQEESEPESTAEEETPEESEPVEESEDVDFTEIPGVGPATAKKLVEAGYGSLSGLKEAGVEGISEVNGVSAALAEKIFAYLD